MGGSVVNPLVKPLEEGIGTEIKQGFEKWLTTSGDQFLRNRGPNGVWLADMLKDFTPHRALYKSNMQLKIKNDIFKNVPDSIADRQHVEDLWAGRNITPISPAHKLAATKLKSIESSVNGLANRMGISQPNGKSLSMTLSGPQFHSEALRKLRSPERTAAIQEIKSTYGINSNSTASSMVDMVLNGQRGRNAYQHINESPIQLRTGLVGDPALRWEKWAEAMGNRIAEVEHFGLHDENLSAIVTAIAHDTGRISGENVAAFLDIFNHALYPASYRQDIAVKNSSFAQAFGGVERAARRIGPYLFTSRIAIPHLGQFINFPLSNGNFKATFEGILGSLTNYSQVRDWALHSGAFAESITRDLEAALRGGTTWFERVFKQPGFHPIRDWQIMAAAHSGRITAQEAASKLLLDPHDTEAKVTLTQLGIDPQEVIQNKALTQVQEYRAGYTGANKAMFFRDSAGTPFAWESSPASRTMAMYRHYTFQQQRLLKNALKEAIERDGGKPGKNFAKVITWLAVAFPAVGGLIAATENILTGQPAGNLDIKPTKNETLNWYINAVAHVGALGVLYSVVRAEQRRKLLNNVVGPILSTSMETLEDVGEAARKGDFNQLGRDALRKLPIVGPYLAEKMIPREKPHKFSAHPHKPRLRKQAQ